MKDFPKLALSLLLASAGATGFAAVQSPEEALSAALAQVASSRINAPGNGAEMQLSYTFMKNSTPGVYVFNAENKSGFMVVSAEQSDAPLLGFSLTDSFDPDNIPPALVWLMEAYSASPAPRNMSERAQHNAIAPMVATQWNQDEPYNNNCPIVGGGRSVTGCVATAMAQLMKVHNWPTQGVGSHSYQWQVNGQTYSTSADFGNTTYDWANMLNSYSSSATSAQKKAVATLMNHCGVASDMNYSPQSSGTSDIYAAQGMIDYFNYDKGIQYLERDWFTASDWDDIVYGELAAGRPLMYCGVDNAGGGHAFVCDGYTSSDYYHINWGWGGIADGYYYLHNLEPNYQGIGSGSGDTGYNYNQSILIGIQPPVDGSDYKPCMFAEGYTTDKSVYERNSSTSVNLAGGFWSYATGTLNYTLGLKLESQSDVQYLELWEIELGPLVGYRSLSFRASDFPVGSYNVSLAYKANGSDWTPLMYPVETCHGYVHFNVTESTITIGDEPTDPDPGDDDDTVTVTTEQLGLSYHNDWESELSDFAFTIGTEYDITWQITTDKAWEDETYMMVLNQVNGQYGIIDYSDPIMISHDAAGTSTASYKFCIPEEYGAGRYYLVLATYDSENYMFNLFGKMLYADFGEKTLQMTSTLVEYTDNAGEPMADNALYYRDTQYTAKWNMIVNKQWNNDVYYCLLEKVQTENGTSFIILSFGDEPVNINSEKGGKYELEYGFSVPIDVEPGTYMVALAYPGQSEGSYGLFGLGYDFVVSELPAQLLDVNFVGDDTHSADYDDPAMIPLGNPEIIINYAAGDEPVETSFALRFTATEINDMVTTPYENVSLGYREAGEVSFQGPWEGLVHTTPYAMDVIDADGNKLNDRDYLLRFDNGSGIWSLEDENGEPVEYFNLQGIRVDNPGHGVYIRRQGNTVKKVTNQ